MLTSVGRAAARRVVAPSNLQRTITTSLPYRPRAVARPVAIRSFTVSAWKSLPAGSASAADKKKAAAEKKKVAAEKKKASLEKKKASDAKKKAAASEKKKATLERKKAAAAAKKAKEAARKKKKQALTPEQKKAAEIKTLKETALLRQEPKASARTAWVVYVGENMSEERKNTSDMGAAMRNLKAKFDELPSSELQRLQAQADANKQASVTAHKAWIESLPVEVTYLANRARRRLAFLTKNKRIPKIDDKRIPKSPPTPYLLFVQSSDVGPSYTQTAAEKMKEVAASWRSVSDVERHRFEEKYASIKASYDAEMATIRQKASEWEKSEKAAASSA